VDWVLHPRDAVGPLYVLRALDADGKLAQHERASPQAAAALPSATECIPPWPKR
jgi:hypothetical protein